ncbi:BufA2 family periplasmic bufferin-type metallophore [Zavarzinia sp. CC-PAN008]|uniref:BufA2 family periplasmic bufferin-type metallophore n=1 Tax=Zavarzinia sp. CC-PAN008 TaxID=3243332 RepID=UPI003F74486A
MKTGFALAAAAAAIFATGGLTLSAPAQASEGVHCAGVNACKGTSECKTASSACKGQNACKGQGWVTESSAEACTGKGGTVAH